MAVAIARRAPLSRDRIVPIILVPLVGHVLKQPTLFPLGEKLHMQFPPGSNVAKPALHADVGAQSDVMRQASTNPSSFVKPAILIIVEGINDMHFLRQISRILHAERPELPDLIAVEQNGAAIFIPIGGSDLRYWFERLSVFGCPEFHLFDRESVQLSPERHAAARLINQRPGCRASVTKKRSLENYLHPAAIRECRPIELTFTDDDDVADLVARECYSQGELSLPWLALPARFRKRLRYRAKRWLNTSAAQRMTASRLAEVDPCGEVRSWLQAIAELLLPASRS
jgi:hypothetical protein